MRASKKVFFRQVSEYAKSRNIPYRLSKKLHGQGVKAFEALIKFQVARSMNQDFKEYKQRHDQIFRSLNREDHSQKGEIQGLWKTIFNQSETNI